MSDFVYLDNNSTTFMPADVIKEMVKWMNQGNPSSSYSAGMASSKKIEEVRNYIATICKIKLVTAESKISTPDEFYILFNSGASESNCYIINSVANAFYAKTRVKPHIIISAIEHKSIINCVYDLESQDKIKATYIYPNRLGFIDPDKIEAAIRPETALIAVMSANNETGAINDYAKIGQIAHKNNIPFHCDCVQSFGKYGMLPIEANVDSFGISFHKIHGPPGVGFLAIKRTFVDGYKLKPLITGSQNLSLRGGTENTPGIVAGGLALRQIMENRDAKNAELIKLKKFIMNNLSKHIPCKSLAQYWQEKDAKPPTLNSIELVFISGDSARYLPNTLLLTVVKRTEPPICNVQMKKLLEKANMIVSIGSACNTKSKEASHVVKAMEFDELLRKGVLRISLCDTSTLDDAKRFVVTLLKVIKECIQNTCDNPTVTPTVTLAKPIKKI